MIFGCLNIQGFSVSFIFFYDDCCEIGLGRFALIHLCVGDLV